MSAPRPVVQFAGRVFVAVACLAGTLGLAAGPAGAAASGELPDLVWMSYGWGYTNECDALFGVFASFQNVSGVPVDVQFGAQLLLDGQGLRTIRAPGADPGELITTPPFDIRVRQGFTGTHVLTLIVDAKDNVAESNETNNESSTEFTCGVGGPGRIVTRT